MKTLLLPFFCFCILSTGSYAQDSLFAFVRVKGGERFAPRPVEGRKYEVARQIFDALIEAKGDIRMPRPVFRMNTGRRFIAWMDPIQREIGLEEKAYDICQSMGADSLNAMAALIAHEIVHYYEKHDWSRHFINLNQNLETSDRIRAADQGLGYEAQADYLGGILAISADYNTYNIFGAFLKKAYEAYGLPPDVDGYPSLQERLQMSMNTADRLRQLHSVYQMANLLTIIGAHTTANQYYQHLLTDYQSYEIYNNAGINAGLAALALFEPKQIPFVLPFELDRSSRLEQLLIRLPQDAEVQRQRLLEQAERWFTSAAQLDKNEPAGLLNLAIVYYLKKELLDADFYAQKTIRLCEENGNTLQAANARIVLGILAAERGKKDQAQAFFEQAASGNPGLSKLNLRVLQEEAFTSEGSEAPAQGVEMVNGLFLDDFLANPELNSTTELSGSVYCGKKTFPESELLIHFAHDGAEYAVFHQTTPQYTGQTRRGISLGAQMDDIITQYQAPDRILSLNKGTCLYYKAQQIFFILDQNGKLVQWSVFQTMLPE